MLASSAPPRAAGTHLGASEAQSGPITSGMFRRPTGSPVVSGFMAVALAHSWEMHYSPKDDTRSALPWRVTLATRIALGREADRMSLPSDPNLRSMGNCQKTYAGPQAQSSGTMSSRVAIVERQRSSRSAVPR